MKEGWVHKTLGEVFDIINGKNQKNVENPKGLYPIMGSGGIMGYADNYLCKEGTTIIGRKGTINKPIYVETKFWNVDTAFGLQPKEGNNSKFLFFLCKSIDFMRYDRGVTIPSLVKSELLTIPISVPPLPEQERIVSELDLLSGIIEKKKAQLKEYDLLAQAIFYDMFGDPVENEKGWEVKKLGEVGNIVTGNTPSTRDNRNYNSNDVCFIKPSDIEKDSISLLSESEFYVSTYAYNNARKLPKGSVLVTCIGIVGKVGILETDATCNQQINAIIPNNQVVSYYVAFSILAKRRIIESIAHAPVVPIINKGTFSQLTLPLPPLSLQQSFAEKIEAIEKQKSLIRQSITETETLFNSRMDYYFN